MPMPVFRVINDAYSSVPRIRKDKGFKKPVCMCFRLLAPWEAVQYKSLQQQQQLCRQALI